MIGDASKPGPHLDSSECPFRPLRLASVKRTSTPGDFSRSSANHAALLKRPCGSRTNFFATPESKSR
jgi:hypothetical protein